MEPRPVIELELNQVGQGTIRLNGEDVSRWVSGVSLKAEVGELTVATLTIPAPIVKVNAPGEVLTELLEDEVIVMTDRYRRASG